MRRQPNSLTATHSEAWKTSTNNGNVTARMQIRLHVYGIKKVNKRTSFTAESWVKKNNKDLKSVDIIQDLKGFAQAQQREIPLAGRKKAQMDVGAAGSPGRLKSYIKSLRGSALVVKSKKKICIISYELIKGHHLQGLQPLIRFRINRAEVSSSFFLSLLLSVHLRAFRK